MTPNMEQRDQRALNAEAMRDCGRTLLRLADEAQEQAEVWERKGHLRNFGELMLESHRLRRDAGFYLMHAQEERNAL